MLHFFRTYQRFFFILITVVIVVSFSFFGTFGSLAQAPSSSDKSIVTSVDGSVIFERDLSALCDMIRFSAIDRTGKQSNQMPYLFNDSVIEKELMATGMGMMLARYYFEDLKIDLEERLLTIRNYRPYAHPKYPYLSAEAVWNRFAPSLTQHLSLLKTKSDQVTMETLGILFQLYLDQAMLPPNFVKQVLSYQMQQYGLPQDPLLDQIDLSLFGFHSFEDWFGPRLVSLVGQFIMNASLFAQQEGYHLSYDLVRADLYRNIVNGYREIHSQREIEAHDIEAYYQAELRRLGGDERLMLNSWRHVMLFRKLFQDVGQSMVVDPLAFEQFHQYTKQALSLNLYESPSYLKFSNLLDLFELQVYLEAVLTEQNSLLAPASLINPIASVELIAQKTPELVEQQIEIEYAEVSKDELIAKMSLKETELWELQDKGWRALTEQFSELRLLQGETVEDRLRHLGHLNPPFRLQVDIYAQQCMLIEQTDRIVQALDLAEYQTIAFGLGVSTKTPLSHVQNFGALSALLRSAPLKNDGIDPSSPLFVYSDDRQHYYRIFILRREEDQQILSFAKAKKDGILSQMLQKRLEKAYPDVRRKNATFFTKNDHTWKPTLEMQELVGRFVFAQLLKSIENEYRLNIGELPGKPGAMASNFYVNHRFHGFMQQAKDAVEKDLDLSKWVAMGDSSVENQFKLIQKLETVERYQEYPFDKTQMFAVPLSGWSNIEMGSNGVLGFYQVVQSEIKMGDLASQMEQGQKLLALDAQRNFMLELLKIIQNKKAINLEGIDEIH